MPKKRPNSTMISTICDFARRGLPDGQNKVFFYPSPVFESTLSKENEEPTAGIFLVRTAGLRALLSVSGGPKKGHRRGFVKS